MFDDPNDVPLTVDFFLTPNFSLLPFTAAVEPLRSANRMAGKTLYHWRVLSEDGKPVQASNGVEVNTVGTLYDLTSSDAVIVAAGIDAQHYKNDRVFGALRRLSRQGAAIGSVCTGAHVLARAGLLEDRRCTIHWENLGGFTEEFPEIEVTSDLFEIDRDRFTCSGGTAALDMMLHLIAKQHGFKLANEVSEQFIHDRIREPHDHQRMELRARLGVSHPKLINVIAEMEANLEEPLSQTALADKAGLSTRQLERLFRKYLSSTPTRYYLNLRLQRARQLLAQTSMSILSVALACGFVSASHFSKCYRECFGRTPRAERAVRHDAPTLVMQKLAG
ncbi:GlxA family transcriptional regulator [Nisaea sp.]|uniref:GlxA family transcriptional regulator n=1 Tax=Nisaea sp. TaxID=2024842 RepID=UPI002B26B125|nr:GlxA family transcriptional regulator [Nisaea sp.]